MQIVKETDRETTEKMIDRKRKRDKLKEKHEQIGASAATVYEYILYMHT